MIGFKSKITMAELYYLSVLAEVRHFGKAAGICGISQPALSVAVKKLEADLGTMLFERSRGNLQVTPFGSQVVEKARAVLEQVAAIEDLASTAKDPLAGPLGLGALPTLGPYWLPQAIPLLRNLAPNLSLYLEEADSSDLGKKLRSGEIDIALISTPFTEPDVVVQPLLQERLMALIPANHSLSNKSPLSVSDISSNGLILLSAEQNLIHLISETFPQLRLDRSATASLKGSSVEAVRNMVASGLGYSLLPESAATWESQVKPLLQVKPLEPQPTRTLALAWRTSFPRHQLVDLLRHALLTSNALYWNFTSDKSQNRIEPLVENQFW